MKKIFAISLLIVFYCFSFNGTLRSSTRVMAAGDSIETIRAHYSSINKNLKRYRKVEKELSGYSAEGGSLIAYFDSATIKKLVARFYGEMGRADEEYYYWNNQLIFVFRKESAYSAPLSGTVVSTKESRFYFDKGRMIRWLDEKGRQVSSNNETYVEKQVEYLKNSREFLALARS